MGLTKGFVFGMVIVFVACYEGLNTREGAVGRRASHHGGGGARVAGDPCIQLLPVHAVEHLLPGRGFSGNPGGRHLPRNIQLCTRPLSLTSSGP